ncbi:MAG: CheR family methyltransferase [Fervidobacterium sp.]
MTYLAERIKFKVLEILKKHGIKIEEKKLNKFVENISDIAQDLPDEVLELLIIDNLTIGESYFFRDRETFKKLREILKQKSEWNILSVGCSRGEEVYTISIVSKELSVNARITGIDVNYQRIEEAKSACYRFWSLRFLSDNEIERYFVKIGDKYCVKEEYKEGVSFYNCNISDCQSLTGKKFDIIFIRRVLIYLDNLESLLKKFYSMLSDKGYLVLGNGEYFKEVYNYFEPAFDDLGCILTRKRTKAEDYKKSYIPTQKSIFNHSNKSRKPQNVQDLRNLNVINKNVFLKLPNSFEEEIKIIESMLENKIYKEAYDKLKILTIKFPTEYLVWKYRGITELELSLKEEARKSIKKAMFLNHYDDEIWQLKNLIDRIK